MKIMKPHEILNFLEQIRVLF